MAENEYQVQEVPETSEEPTPKARMVRELILYKMDRTLAVVGIILIASLGKTGVVDINIANTAISALGVYLGIKGGK